MAGFVGIRRLLWLNLPAAPDGSLSTGLAFLFLVLAEAFWPIYAPIAVMLIEPDQGRRRLILACVAAGLGVGTYLLWYIVNWPHGAVIQDGHIVYINGTKHGVVVALAYLAGTALPLMLSTQRMVVALGGIVLVGLVVAYALYWEAFVSVWCFFAAAASIMIVLRFKRVDQSRLAVVALNK